MFDFMAFMYRSNLITCNRMIKPVIMLFGSVSSIYTFSYIVSVKRRGVYDVDIVHKQKRQPLRATL